MSVPCPGSGNQPARGPNRAARRAKNLHTMTVTDYERERQERIAKNKAILSALDIPKAINSTPKRVARISPKKRKRRDSDVDGGSSVKAVDKPPLVRRTSARLQNIVEIFWKFSDDSRAAHTMRATMRNQNKRRTRILNLKTKFRMGMKRTSATKEFLKTIPKKRERERLLDLHLPSRLVLPAALSTAATSRT